MLCVRDYLRRRTERTAVLLLDSFTLDSFTLAGLRLDHRDVRLLSFASLAGFSSRASILVVSPAAAFSRASRAAITSSREGTHNLSSKVQAILNTVLSTFKVVGVGIQLHHRLVFQIASFIYLTFIH